MAKIIAQLEDNKILKYIKPENYAKGIFDLTEESTTYLLTILPSRLIEDLSESLKSPICMINSEEDDYTEKLQDAWVALTFNLQRIGILPIETIIGYAVQFSNPSILKEGDTNDGTIQFS